MLLDKRVHLPGHIGILAKYLIQRERETLVPVIVARDEIYDTAPEPGAAHVGPGTSCIDLDQAAEILMQGPEQIAVGSEESVALHVCEYDLVALLGYSPDRLDILRGRETRVSLTQHVGGKVRYEIQLLLVPDVELASQMTPDAESGGLLAGLCGDSGNLL